MKAQIENLKALIHGDELTSYQRALALNEWVKLIVHIEELEQLATPDVSKSVEPVGEATVCECSIPMTTMELPHRCVKCKKPIKWNKQTVC